VLRHLIAEGRSVRLRAGQRGDALQPGVDDYDRATEFEALGGKLIELGTAEWKGLAEAI
jgi:hypothetical protein